jgi:hypothetical protein
MSNTPAKIEYNRQLLLTEAEIAGVSGGISPASAAAIGRGVAQLVGALLKLI